MTSRKPTPASRPQREQQTNEVERERLKRAQGHRAPSGPEVTKSDATKDRRR